MNNIVSFSINPDARFYIHSSGLLNKPVLYELDSSEIPKQIVALMIKTKPLCSYNVGDDVCVAINLDTITNEVIRESTYFEGLEVALIEVCLRKQLELFLK